MAATSAERYALDEFDRLDAAPQPQPRGMGGRRRNPRPVNRTAFYVTHLVLGVVIGTSIGIYSLVGAHWLFARSTPLLSHLWWLDIVLGLVGMVVIKNQMDGIRQTVFIAKVDGKVQQLRVRRRHEVVMTLVKRAVIAALTAVVLLVGIHAGIQHYRAELGDTVGRTVAARGLLPAVGDDVLLVVFAVATVAVTLTVCELTLRTTQKEGFAYAALWLFVPATVTMGLSILHATSFLR